MAKRTYTVEVPLIEPGRHRSSGKVPPITVKVEVKRRPVKSAEPAKPKRQLTSKQKAIKRQDAKQQPVRKLAPQSRPDATGDFKCSQCGRIFLMASGLLAHQKIGKHGRPNGAERVPPAHIPSPPVRTKMPKVRTLEQQQEAKLKKKAKRLKRLEGKKVSKPTVAQAAAPTRPCRAAAYPRAKMCSQCRQVPPIPGDDRCYQCIK